MPKNNSLKPVNLPMVKKFDKTPETEFILYWSNVGRVPL